MDKLGFTEGNLINDFKSWDDMNAEERWAMTSDGVCVNCGSYQFDMVWGCYDCGEWPDDREKSHQEKIGRPPKKL